MHEPARPGTPRIRGHHHHVGARGPRQRHYITGIVGAVAAVIAAGVSTAATISSAQTQAEAQKNAAKFNQQVAENQAFAAREAASVAEENQRTQDRRVLAATRARAAASGLDPNEGTSLLAEMENASTSELNARRIRWAGANQQAGYQAEAQLQAFSGAQAPGIRRAGYLTGGTKLLTGITNAADVYATRPKSPASPANPYDPGNANMLY